MRKQNKRLAVVLVKAMARELIGQLPRHQVLPKRRKAVRDRVKDDV